MLSLIHFNQIEGVITNDYITYQFSTQVNKGTTYTAELFETIDNMAQNYKYDDNDIFKINKVNNSCIASALAGAFTASTTSGSYFDPFWNCYVYRIFLDKKTVGAVNEMQSDEILPVYSYFNNRNIILINIPSGGITFYCDINASISSYYDIIVYNNAHYRYLPPHSDIYDIIVRLVTTSEVFTQKHDLHDTYHYKDCMSVEINKGINLIKNIHDKNKDVINSKIHSRIIDNIKTYHQELLSLDRKTVNMINELKTRFTRDITVYINKLIDEKLVTEISNYEISVRNLRNKEYQDDIAAYEIQKQQSIGYVFEKIRLDEIFLQLNDRNNYIKSTIDKMYNGNIRHFKTDEMKKSINIIIENLVLLPAYERMYDTIIKKLSYVDSPKDIVANSATDYIDAFNKQVATTLAFIDSTLDDLSNLAIIN